MVDAKVKTPVPGDQMTRKQTIDDVEVRGKRVLVRVDFNVPMANGKITDDRRIQQTLPTLRALNKNGARSILVTHLGRPHGVDPSLSVLPVAARAAELLGHPIPVATDLVGPSARALASGLHDGEFCMLENSRFDLGEEQNLPEFAKALASLADIYVNDAFGSYRPHATTEGVAHYLPGYAGYLMDRELRTLGELLRSPKPPFVVITGGSKVSTKVGIIAHLLPGVDELWIGGAMANTFLRAAGKNMGKSLVEEGMVTTSADLMQRDNTHKLKLPIDLVVVRAVDKPQSAHVVSTDDVPSDEMVVDVGPATVEAMARSCERAQTVLWTGPVGMYEIPDFAHGTEKVAKNLIQTKATTIIGGGDLGAVFNALGLADSVSHLSTGGGAMLEFLQGKPLPCVAALRDRDSAQ